MTWLTEAAALLSGGSHPPCAAGHDTHATRAIRADLAGHDVPDWPRLDFVPFDLSVFDAERYRDTRGYCPGDTDVSRTLIEHWAWEAWESVLAIRLLWTGAGAVLDFGANVGWYSVLALRTGHPVLAVEADHAIANVCEANLAANMRQPPAGQQTYEVARGWIGPDTPMLPVGPRVRLLKADLEGQEAEVMRVCGRLFAAGLVDYVLAEESPCFGPVTWVKVLEDIGFRAFVCPDKQDAALVEAFEDDPLGFTLARPYRPCAEQANILLVAPHLL